MSIRFFRWTFVGLMLADFGLMAFSSPQSIGASAEWSDDRYRFAGGTQPWFLVIASLIAVSYFASMNMEAVEPGLPLAGMFRRFVGFWFDFVLAMMAIAPVIGIAPVVVEWRRTGVFAWTFDRNTPGQLDSFLTIGGALVSFAVLFFYYLFPLVRRRPSPGACIVGYQIVSDEGKSLTFVDASIRTLLGIVAIAGWFVTAFIRRGQENGKLWFDLVLHTRAVKL